MKRPPVISRRALLAAFWLAGTSLAGAQVKKRGNDQGNGPGGGGGGPFGPGGGFGGPPGGMGGGRR
ncbi:hypothetical protein AOQ73_32275 [Bradyrhizobium pachyrhizi]|uniref:hypothetical protein n=1 Tax=Bradyrhizobium pachyrhizi TaxID=280333 RepID=UPI000704F9BC|nr:hypothetical protein [Bradyrhizobium pachyrhizi]KRP87883.1 hypothetical protein AOQ73_32275 [Bradyrhizobium pachyrhizi]